MATLTMPEAFLQDVIEHKDDDAPRLIFADWLTDHGDVARAEFIRVQCELVAVEAALLGVPVPGPRTLTDRYAALRRRERELLESGWPDWHPGLGSRHVFCANLFTAPPCPDPNVTFRRGFVAEITCRLGDWCGGPCGRCSGTGHFRVLDDVGRPHRGACPDCDAAGRTPGHGPALVRPAPLEHVTLSDRQPWDRHISGRWWWVAEDTSPFTGYQVPESCLLPADLMRYLPSEGLPRGYGLTAWRSPGGRGSRQAALDAASTALLAWARAQPVTS